MKRPVRPVGVPGSRYRADLRLASSLAVPRMISEVNGAGWGGCAVLMVSKAVTLERALGERALALGLD